mgnify:CR=1 FL=1
MRYPIHLPALLLTAGLVPACQAGGLVHPQLAPDTVALAIGQAATLDGLTVRFVEVPTDSRCPTDVVCVWAGNAKVVLNTVVGGVERALALNTNAGSATGPGAVEVDGFRITLLGLDPAPRSEEPIPAGAYRATLELDRD